jgi:hypothetical protein
MRQVLSPLDGHGLVLGLVVRSVHPEKQMDEIHRVVGTECALGDAHDRQASGQQRQPLGERLFRILTSQARHVVDVQVGDLTGFDRGNHPVVVLPDNVGFVAGSVDVLE